RQEALNLALSPQRQARYNKQICGLGGSANRLQESDGREVTGACASLASRTRNARRVGRRTRQPTRRKASRPPRRNGPPCPAIPSSASWAAAAWASAPGPT